MYHVQLVSRTANSIHGRAENSTGNLLLPSQILVQSFVGLHLHEANAAIHMAIRAPGFGVQDMAFGFKLTEVRGVRDTAGCGEAAKHVGQGLLQQTSSSEPSVDASLELPPQQPNSAAWQAERQIGMPAAQTHAALLSTCCTPSKQS